MIWWCTGLSGWESICQVSPPQVTSFSPFAHCNSLPGGCYVQATNQELGVTLPFSLSTDFQHQLLGIFKMELFLLFLFCSVAKSCPNFCNPMNCSKPGFPAFYYLLEFTQTHAHWVGDAIQRCHPLSIPSPPAFNLSQHQSLFQWVSSSHQVAKVLGLQLPHQSFRRILRIDFL